MISATLSTYKRIIRKLLPVGPVWDKVNDTFDLLVEAFAAEPLRVHENGQDLIDESNPGRSTLLLSEYEAFALAADEKPVGGETTSQRQQVLLAKMRTAYSGPSRAFFIALAAKLGMTVTVLDGSSIGGGDVSRVEESFIDDDRVSEEGEAYRWEIHVVSDPDSQLTKLQALVERLKPAHTEVVYT